MEDVTLQIERHARLGDTQIPPVQRIDFAGQPSPEVASRAKLRREVRARLCSAALASADLAACAASGWLAFRLAGANEPSPFARAVENLNALGPAWHGWGSLLVLVCLLSFVGCRGHYTSRVPSWTSFGDLVTATVIALACDAFLTIAVYGRPLQPEGLFRWLLLCPCLMLARTLTREALRSRGLWSLDTLIVASSADLDAATAALYSDPALGYRVMGTMPPETACALPEPGLLRMVSERGFDFVVVAVGVTHSDQEAAVIEVLRRGGVAIGLVPVLPGLPVTGFRRHYFLGHDLAMLVSKSNLAAPFNRLLKAVFDQLVAAILLVLFAPLLAALAVLVRRDGGPALYRHQRIGADGRMFACIKFRTMVVDAERQLRRLLDADPRAAAEWADGQKLANDPRITRIGSFLRRSSLDELPQLFNVLRGEMSLVGPRPIVAAEAARYGADIQYYYEAKPGITGLWQVSGRSDTGYAVRVKLDVWYVRNWTLWHDIAILFKTIPAVFWQRGAC